MANAKQAVTRVSKTIHRMEKLLKNKGKVIWRNNKMVVRGTVELGEDGFVEILLFSKSGGQVVHAHRYPEGSADLWIFPPNNKYVGKLR